MTQINSILIEGVLADDPVFRKTKEGMSLCTFILSSSTSYRQDSGLEKEVGFFDVLARAKVAENCQKLGYKGRGVRVVGHIKQEWVKRLVGESHSKVVIVAEHVEFRPETKKDK
jgi:single-strand DNA-binding protein